jgi:hypothetical protein
MHPSFHGGRLAIAVVLLIVFVSGAGPRAAGQPAATPEDACPAAGGSPVAEPATPAHASPTPVAAGTPAPVIRDGSVVDAASLTAALLACGLAIDSLGSVEQPFLKPGSGTVLRLGGGNLAQPADVQVFEYQSAERAAADAAQIGPDGNPPTMMIDWIAPPHFFRAGRVIVLYIGEDQSVVDLLTALLGSPFAGR